MANKILLKGSPIAKEAACSGAVTPGMLLDRNGSKVQAHGSTGGNAEALFADMEDYLGYEISNAYADGDKVKFLFCQPGDEINALLTCGATSFSVGDYLESDGNGYLKAYTAPAFSGGDISGSEQTIYSKAPVAQVLEATTGSTGSNDRITVEVI